MTSKAGGLALPSLELPGVGCFLPPLLARSWAIGSTYGAPDSLPGPCRCPLPSLPFGWCGMMSRSCCPENGGLCRQGGVGKVLVVGV